MNFIKKIQKKPRSTRVLILWVATFLAMIIIIAIWLFSFSRNFNPSETQKEVGKTDLPSLFESLRKDFSTLKDSLKANVEDIEDIYEQQQQE